jgi:hypothetical protein
MPMRTAFALTGLFVLWVWAAWVPPAGAQNQPSDEISYKPPPHGAPGRRVAGAARGAAAALPTIDLLAPDGHAGETASATPVLYYFASGPVGSPMQLTISAPRQPRPLVEADIPAPGAAGLYALRLADFHTQLIPGVVYTWSVSIIVDRKVRANDVVASASLLRMLPDPAVEAALRNSPPTRRAALLAQAGLWYDAVAAAAETKDPAIDALMDQVGLEAPAKSDRRGR